MKDIIVNDNKHLFILSGISASGKSTFAKANFNPYEILSLDTYREQLYGAKEWGLNKLDKEAVALQMAVFRIQLRNEVMLCMDNLNLKPKYYREHIKEAREAGYKIHLVRFMPNVRQAIVRDERRERSVGERAIRKQEEQFERADWDSIKDMFDYVHDGSNCRVVREPFTVECEKAVIFGDIQGMAHKLTKELEKHGFYIKEEATSYSTTHYVEPRKFTWVAPKGVKLFFVGDIPDRGDSNVRALQIVKSLCDNGYAYVAKGNHDRGLQRVIAADGVQTKKRQFSPQSFQTFKEMDESISWQEIKEIGSWLENLPLVIRVNVNGHKAVISHFGIFYWNDRKENTELLPNGYEQEEILRGVRTGRKTRHGRLEIKHPIENAHNTMVPYEVIHGHANMSDAHEGFEFTVPHKVGNFICLESHIENGPEFPVGVWVIE